MTPHGHFVIVTGTTLSGPAGVVPFVTSVTALNPQILIVEDSLVQALQLQRVLEPHGYDVAVARDGRECLDVLRTQQPAIIISDIHMPQMDGYVMCRAIKHDPALRHIPVVLLTTLTDAQDLIRGLEAQADYYLTKPYDAPVLLARIRHLLEHPPPDPPANAGAPVTIVVDGQEHIVTSDRGQILNLLLSTYENAVHQNRELARTQRELELVNQQLRIETAKLEQSQANYRALLENNADAMIVVDRSGNVRFLNPAARALFGPEDQQFLSDILRHPDTAGTTLEVSIERTGRDPIIAELQIVETQWEHEPASLATLRDITSRKAYERQIAELEAHLTV